MNDLRARTAVVTGGGSGIGRGMALAFAAEGMNVVVSDIEASAAEAVAAEVSATGVNAAAVRCDVSDTASVANLADHAFATFGEVHLLCNNAGVLLNKPVAEATAADWEWILSVNLHGVIRGIDAFLPRMRAQASPAHIVNTASLAGVVAEIGSGLGIYGASKYAVVAISEVLRVELADEQIGVSVLCPGGVRTRIHEAARNRPDALGGPTEVGNTRRPGPEYQGMDPIDVGHLVVDGVRANRPYIFTHHENRAAVQERFANILEAFAFTV